MTTNCIGESTENVYRILTHSEWIETVNIVTDKTTAITLLQCCQDDQRGGLKTQHSKYMNTVT